MSEVPKFPHSPHMHKVRLTIEVDLDVVNWLAYQAEGRDRGGCAIPCRTLEQVAASVIGMVADDPNHPYNLKGGASDE